MTGLVKYLLAAIEADILAGVSAKLLGYIKNIFFSDWHEDNDIERLVGKKLPYEKVQEIKAKVKKTADWIEKTYLPLQISRHNKEKLAELLKPTERQIVTDWMAILQEREIAEQALGAFIVAACLHLSILQELALVDPQKQPRNSIYVRQILPKYAMAYAKHAENTFETIMSKRLKYISVNKEIKYEDAVSVVTFTVTDNFLKGDKVKHNDYLLATTEYESGFKYTEEDIRRKVEEANKKLKQYKDQIREEMNQKLANPLDAAKQWRKMANNPWSKL